MRKIVKWLVCSILLICCSLLVDVSKKITASAQESEVVEEIASTSNNTQTIYFMGQVEFDYTNIPSNATIPSLYGNLIYIYKVDNDEYTSIDTVALDKNGEYCSEYEWDGVPFTAMIKLVVGDEDIIIGKEDKGNYSYETTVSTEDLNLQNQIEGDITVSLGNLNLGNLNLDNLNLDNLILGDFYNAIVELKAFTIAETLFLARDYAEEMMEEDFEAVNVLYPALEEDGNFYNHTNSTINMLPNFYPQGNGLKAFTDTLLHEYGHYVQCQIGMIYEHELASHSFTDDLTLKDGYTKEKALKIAWIEGWATAFAMQVKNYWAVNGWDTLVYRVSASSSYNMEYGCPKKGEGCEGSIVGVLWDIWDGGTGDDDGISMSFQAWWDLTTQEVFHEETRTVGRILTINEFVKVFYIYKTNTINTTNTTNATPINELREILAVYSIEVDCIKNDHLGTYIEWIEEEIIDIYMITAGNTSGNYYNFSVESDYFPDEPLMIGFDGNGYFYYIECQIEKRSIEAYEYKIYVTISGTGGYCWLIGENGTMVDACLRTDDGLVVPFTSIYNNETGIFYLYPTTNNINMIYVQDTEVKLEVKYKEYVYLKNQNSAL